MGSAGVQTTHLRLGIGLALCLILGATLRLTALGDRPMHCDEAVHAWKLHELWRSGAYYYDPHEYHGPTLYYLTLPVLWLEQPKSFADFTESQLRIVPVMVGLAMIALVGALRDALSDRGAIFAAMLTAVSTAMTFYSRYYIQETLLVFFTFVLIVGAWRFLRTGRLVWAFVLGAGVGLMHATKETCVISLGCAAAAGIVWRVWARADIAFEIGRGALRGMSIVRRSAHLAWTPTTDRLETMHVPEVRAAKDPSRGTRTGALGAVVALLTAVAVSVAFYSSFLIYAQGPIDSLRTFATYFDRAGNHGLHDHPWDYYLRILTYVHWAPGPWWSEASILLLAIIGGARAFTRDDAARAQRLFLRWLLPYTVLMFAVYSAIPYKTPWCILGALHGCVLLAGVGAAELVRWVRRWPSRLAVGVVLTVITLHLAWQTARADGRFCCDNRNPYVYAHTVRDVNRLGEFVHKLASAHPRPDQMLVRVITPDYWPLPWTLRGLPNVGYWDAPPDDGDADVIITDVNAMAPLTGRLRQTYATTYYGLRPDVTLAVMVEESLWKQFQSSRR